MAGRYSRTYSRKKSTTTPPISQFDRLVSEHGKSAHPVASKTAGHIGKWGITSFTSLRSISENLGKEEAGKRNWIDSPPSGTTEVVFPGVPVSDTVKVAAVPKKRKFFKTRDLNNVSNPLSSASSSSINNCEETTPDPPNVPLINPVSRGAYTTPKYLTSENNSYKSVVSCNKALKSSSGVPINKSSGGIKLKIFKQRSNDLNVLGTYSSTVQLPSDDSASSSSNSSSVANSPKSELSCQSEGKCTVSPNGLVPDPPLPDCDLSPHLPDCDIDPVESMKENLCSDNLSYKSDFKSNLSYHEINEKLQSSPLLSTNLEVPDTATESCQDNLLSYKLSPFGSVNSICEKDPSLPDNDLNGSFNLAGKEILERSLTHVEIEKAELTNAGKTEWLERINEPSSSPSQALKLPPPREMDLFSTDFDENEIVDRTSIEYSSSSCSYDFGEKPLSRASTIDLNEVASLQSSSASSLNEAPFTRSLSQPEFDSKSSTMTKKRSIFKSRQKEGESKKRATYKHKWHGHEDKEENLKEKPPAKLMSSSEKPVEEDPFSFDTTPVVTRVQTWPSSSQTLDNSFEEVSVPIIGVKCPKQAKKYFTVIKNVKKTHQLQESGEFQEFNDDVEYFLDALRSSNSVSTRCLASLNLAQKCMTPAFRMHLRAHATVSKFFRALSDAPSHPHLAECAAMVMFALSQDRLNMDLDRSSLELMLNLLDTDLSEADSSNQLMDAADHGSKIQGLCKELQQKGHAKHLKLDSINAATLSMETLLSLTSKRAGEWFKEELRELGGVDHLIRTVTSSCVPFSFNCQNWTASLLDKLSKIDRCLKVLENVTHQNEANQEYLLSVNDGAFSGTLMHLFRMCRAEVPLHPLRPQDPLTLTTHNPAAAKGIITALVTTLKVLINLTHGTRKEALGSQILGKDNDIYDIAIYCLLMMPMYLDHDTKFEIQVLACCLLLNLVENSLENRKRLMNLTSPVARDDEENELFNYREQEGAMSSLVTLFYTSEESARVQEAHTDRIIDTDLTQEVKEEEKRDEEIEETVARLLQKAGRHMEDTLIAAYTALLAGYCIMDSKEFEEKIRYMQPEGHFKIMVAVLKKFLHFMKMTATTSLLRSLKPTERVVKYMEKLDRTPEEEAEEKRKKEAKEEAAQAMAFEAFGF